MKRQAIIKIIAVIGYAIFVLVSFQKGFSPGKQICFNFFSFAVAMLKVLPFAFILIGLFDVWVKKETVEKHLGEGSSVISYFWMILLASTTAGGLYVAFPIAYALYNKGAKLSVIFTYIGAAAVARIPMAIFEASFMGIKFTTIRLFTSVPLVIITAILLGNYLTKKNFKMKNS